MRKTMNSIGWKYALMGVLYIFIQVILELIISWIFPNFYDKYSIYIALTMVIISVDIVGFPLLFLLTLKMPKGELEHEKMTFGKFMLCVLIMYGLTMVGLIAGSIFHLPLTRPFEKSNQLMELMLGSNFFFRILVVGILAPIFEELIFRKLLIDHVSVHGYYLAILASGIMFGLFHGNFQQGGFAMLIGFLFAYIYIKTGKVIYTILLHMVMNCVTSAVTLGIYQWVIKAGNRIGIDMMDSNVQYDERLLTQEVLKGDLGAISFMASCTVLMIWFGILFLTAVAGLVLFIVFAATKRIKITKKEGHETVGKQIKGLFSPAMWLFYVLCAILFGLTYLPPIIEFIVNAIKNR